MKRSTFRGAALVVTAATLTALGAVGASPASAAPNQYAPSIGTATGTVTTTDTGIPVSIRTSAPCPSGTTAINGFFESTAAAIPAGSLIIGANQTDVGNMTTSGVPLADNLKGLASAAGKVLVNGVYDVQILCLPDPFSAPTAQFDGSFTVSGGVGTGAGTTAVWAVAAAPSSTTVLSVSPASPQALGASVTLSATVTSSAAVSGTVQFRSGTTALGAPVAVTGGAASLTTTALPAGTLSLTAEFIPAAGANISGSTSAAVPFTITAPAQATTTTLSSSPAAPTTADAVTLSAAVTVGSGTVNSGTVVFSEGGTTVGTAAVTNGTASISLTGLTAGGHTYTAVYQGNAAFLTSTSATVTVTVTQFAGVTATETITATVGAGALTITAGGAVDLGTLALNSGNTLLVSTPKDLAPVTVTDTRAGQLGWTVNGSVTDFTGPGTAKINGENLGWTPRVISAGAGQTVAAGPSVAPANGVAPGAAATGAGIKASKVLATAANGASIGTAQLTAALLLQAPTSTTAGSYSTTLTLTAL
jgi:hypothetical protein